MFNISQFLEKFKILGLSEVAVKDALTDAARECVGVEIARKDIDFRNGVLYIRANPVLKNQIYIKKTSIIECLNKKLQTKVKDIR